MKKLYTDILNQIERGKPSAIITTIPRGNGKVKKSILHFNETAAEPLQSVINEGSPHVIEEEDHRVFVEPVQPKDRLIILGGGHIALPLVRFASETGFSVTVVDDRPAFANEDRFPQAARVMCETFEDCFDILEVSEYDYVVIVTRGHRHDTLCLRNLLSKKEPFYLGMIGSKRRVKAIKDMMLEEGFEKERIHRIFTPIGLEIGAVTPEEISVSILAELIKKKRLESAGRVPRHRSDLDPEVIETLAKQHTDSCAVVTVLTAKGSVPRRPGAKMIVYPNRSIVGSIGGGCSESEVIWDAMSIIGTGRHMIKTIDLTGDVAENEGMVCGGVMEVLVEDFTGSEKMITRDEAWELLNEYNKDPFHLKHAMIVEGTMRYFAELLGYGEEAEFWGIVGLLHDLDFGMYPDQHCIKQEEIMRARGIDERIIHATVSHGYGLTVDVKPEHEMEKVLYAADELTGLIGAVALMRPSKSVSDLELKSVKKKYKTLNFAAGCSREVIEKGAEMLGWELDYLIEQTILAMRTCE